MRWNRGLATAALAAALAGWTAPAARAHDEVRIEVRTPRLAVAFGGHTRACTYVPGHYGTRTIRTVVRAGHWVTTVEPAVHEWRWSWSARRFVRVCVKAERVVRRWVPPVVRERVVRDYVRGAWDCRGHADGC